MTDIVVVGSANLDLVVEVARVPVVGETVLGGDLRRLPGGKGANQAVAAARLGRRTALVGRVGDDDAGETLRGSLTANDVDTTQLRTTPDTPSGVALISVDADGDNAIVVSPGANGRLQPADVTAAGHLLHRAAVVLVQLEIPLDAVVAAASAAGGTVIVNPAPAPPRPLPTELLDGAILVPNQTELATLAGHDGVVDTETAVELARRLPASATVVTLGAEGALVVDDDVTHVPAPVVDPVDTTAAGDAFCAALADALVGGAGLADAARWAVRVGAATTLRPGAQPSLPTPAEVASRLG